MVVPDFLVIGHLVKDVGPDGWRAGGTVTYASLTAGRLGLDVGVVTTTGRDIEAAAVLPGARVSCRPSAATTCFENRYVDGRRRQWVEARADTIGADDVPADWRSARIVLVGPVCGEVAPGVSSAFPRSLVGVSAQGWLRRIDRRGRVLRRRWQGEPFWRGAQVLFVSEEDVGRERADVRRWAGEVPIVAFTRGWRGARIFFEGRWRRLGGFPEEEVDPTGAGDVFATAFLIRLDETKDVSEAARFAGAAASLSVAGVGVERLADRAEVEARVAAYPEIRLR